MFSVTRRIQKLNKNEKIHTQSTYSTKKSKQSINRSWHRCCLGNKKLIMRNIELSESDCMFVHYALKQYAMQTEDLDVEDQKGIREIAAKFK